jgi:hypothetical protein
MFDSGINCVMIYVSQYYKCIISIMILMVTSMHPICMLYHYMCCHVSCHLHTLKFI